MNITLRLEEEYDRRNVENVTREAFWNVYTPGSDVHLLVHSLRKAKEFIKELDFVAVYNNTIVGNIVYVEAKIIDLEKEYAVLTFGPWNVFWRYQQNLYNRIGGLLCRLQKE